MKEKKKIMNNLISYSYLVLCKYELYIVRECEMIKIRKL